MIYTLKTGDRVILTSGKDKGKIGNVKKIIASENKVIVEGANMITKAQKPNPMAGIQGGLTKLKLLLILPKLWFTAHLAKKQQESNTILLMARKYAFAKNAVNN